MSIFSEYDLEMTMGDASEQAYLDRLDDMAPLLGKLGAVYQEQPEQHSTTGGLTDRDRWLCLEAAAYLEGQLEKSPAPFLQDCFNTAARELRRLSGH